LKLEEKNFTCSAPILWLVPTLSNVAESFEPTKCSTLAQTLHTTPKNKKIEK